jgi:TolB protein
MLAALVVLGAFLTACGDDDEAVPPSTAQPAVEPTAALQPATTTPVHAVQHEIVNSAQLADGRHRVYCVDGDGSDLHALTSEEWNSYRHDIYEAFPAWSPDGARVAFVRTGRTEDAGIYVVNVDGTQEWRIVGDWARDISWSPDGTKLAFAWLKYGWPPDENYPLPNHMNIAVTNVDGTGPQVVSDRGDADAGPISELFPVWSPDGSRILYQTWTHSERAEDDVVALSVVNGDGTGLRELDTGEVGALAMGSIATWTPDGTRIVFAGGVPDDPNPLGLFTMTSEGADLRRLSPADVPILGTFDWSPDGSRIAFSSVTGELSESMSLEGAEIDLYIMNADGTGVQPLLTTPGTHDLNPQWSPDGTRLLDQSTTTGAEAAINVVNADRTHQMTVLSGVTSQSETASPPMWRPDVN